MKSLEELAAVINVVSCKVSALVDVLNTRERDAWVKQHQKRCAKMKIDPITGRRLGITDDESAENTDLS